MPAINERRSLLSSQARIQVPWVRVQIGKYVFGVRDRKNPATMKDADGFYVGPKNNANLKYFPDMVQRLSIVKINGKVNTYTLQLSYAVTQNDDPNFFEKVLSSVSLSRQIVFTYGDAAQPNYIYKDETAIITKVQSNFQFESSVINYTITAVSNGLFASSGSYTFPQKKNVKPSDQIKKIFKNKTYGLSNLFTGMSASNIDQLIASDDKAVDLHSKTNISILDYITYLVSCMLPAGSTQNNLTKDLYILTIHDDTTYDKLYNDTPSLGGPYFKVTKVSNNVERADAYTIDIGYNTSTTVSNFAVSNNQNYSILYNYQAQLNPQKQVKRLNQYGQWETVYAPATTSDNIHYQTRAQDVTWWTKITQFPITATIIIQGLLRPAHLLTYLRLNVIFPGGHKHISSGLYIVTQQQDTIDGNGYKTQLQLTKIAGDPSIQLDGVATL